MEKRKSTEIIILGPGITEQDEFMEGARLPTNKQVFRCFLYHKHKLKLSKYEAEDQLTYFYVKSGVPMVTNSAIHYKIDKLYRQDKSLKKHPDRYETDKAKLNEKMSVLDLTFPGWRPKALEEMTNEADKEFLRSMMGDRKGSCPGKFVFLIQMLSSEIIHQNGIVCLSLR